MKYQLVILWTTGEKDVHNYKTQYTAENAEKNMKMAFGNQIAWSCIRER